MLDVSINVKEGSSSAGLAGGIVGGLVGLGFLFLVGLYLHKKKTNRKK